MRCFRFLVSGLIVSMLGRGTSQAASTDCKWPPLNAVERRQTNPVRVGDEIFTTGFYSYWVNAYHIDNLHCVKSINWGPREWAVAIGLGGNEPIGPHRISSGAPANNIEPGNRHATGRAAINATSGALTPMPSLAPLPSLPQATTAKLSDLAPLPPAPQNGVNQALPSMKSLAPLPSSTP